MKKFFLILISLILFAIPISYADNYDTNVVIKGSSAGNGTEDLYKYWVYSKTTGTRYVLRVYDWNTEKYIPVPKEYYINHISNDGKEIMYLGVDKTRNGSYTVVKSGSSIFQDTTYSHVIKWFNNSKVKNFGLTHADVTLLAQIIKDKAEYDGNVSLAKNMQEVIDGIVPYDVRAEILFLMKVPGTTGKQRTGQVTGKGSMENYSFTFYDNTTNGWRMEYLTYLEIKAITYAIDNDCGIVMKAYWLDKVACALFENDYEYVFANNTYQCSCDLYKRKFGSNAVYTLVNNKITLNQRAYEDSSKDNKWYRYYCPGRCGIPISISGTTYYLTPGQTYPNLNGKKVKLHSYTKFTDTNKGIESQDTDYLNIVSNDPTTATIYEGWDYITNNLAATLVLAIDKDTGNIISVNGKQYSQFEIVKSGTYTKKAWDISGYRYLGYISKTGFSIPSVPLGVSDSSSTVNMNITSSDVNNGTKKMVIFVYEKGEENDDVATTKEARLSIYNMKNGRNTLMYSGKYFITPQNTLNIVLYDKNGSSKYTQSMNFDLTNGYNINTYVLESLLGIQSSEYKYAGNLIKTHSDYFLGYFGESLLTNSGNVYNLKNVNDQKVHIILGYTPVEIEIPVIPPVPPVPPMEPDDDDPIIDFPVIPETYPELKISYLDNYGNSIKGSTVTTERVGRTIISTAPDYRSEFYMYLGYTYVDTYYSFGSIGRPVSPMSTGESVFTMFSSGDDRRHIAFIYRKIDLKFQIDIVMDPDDLENQLIGQNPNEDYWVLDEAGRVYLKATVTGTEGLNILNYTIKLKIPFDVYINGNYIKANSVNNVTVRDISNAIVANKLMVPIWVTEKEYTLSAIIDANIEGFGIFSSKTKTDDVEVVGKLYDFSITNIDGSEQTGDEMWKESLFSDIDTEYKASEFPVGQEDQQPEKYNYGIKLGTYFYFSVNTKGAKNEAISIVPKFYYVSTDRNTVKEADVFIKDNGVMKNILSDDVAERYMKMKDGNILKQEVVEEIQKAQAINRVSNRYNYSTLISRSIGRYSNILLSKYFSLPYARYMDEFKSMYGVNAATLANKTETEILLNASHWYGKYIIPASSKIVDKGGLVTDEGYEDGYLIVCFKIVSLDSEGNEYLSYDLPVGRTQWQKEELDEQIKLPIINSGSNNIKMINLNTLKDEYAPVMIYQIGVSTYDNNTSAGTH